MTKRYGVTRVLSSILAAGLVVRKLTNHDTAHTMRVAAYTEPHGLPARDTQKHLRFANRSQAFVANTSYC
jgi:hypothetical protein